MEGCQVVLGAQWMKELNEICFNFKKLQVRFFYKDKEYKWQGLIQPDVHPVDDKIATKEFNFALLKFMLLATSSASVSSMPSIHQDIQALLNKFPAVISSAITLPLARYCDHKISLLQGSKPVCLKPYRYSHCIKNELDKLITDMLSSGIIRNSSGTFSAPVVMV